MRLPRGRASGDASGAALLRFRIRVRPRHALLLGGLAAACATGSEAAPGVVVRDSAGVTIVENPAELLDRVLAVSAEPLVSIGVAEGAPEYQLFGVRDVARLSDGRIVIANGGSREVRWYAPDGSFLFAVGGEGRGPEDLRLPMSVAALGGDTVVVDDFGDRVLWDAEGRFVRRETLDRQRWASLWTGRFSEVGAWLGDGTRFEVPFKIGDMAPPGGRSFRPELLFARVASDASRVDTLGVFGGIEQQEHDVGGARPTTVSPPYYANTVWAYANDGTIAVGDNQRAELRVFAAGGARRVVRWSATPRPVTAAEVEAWKERQRGMSWVEGQLPQLERGWAAMTVPSSKPFYEAVGVGPGGVLWVALDDPFDATVRWVSFDREGRMGAMLTLPGPFRIVDAGDTWLLGVHQDANEVEYLRMYRVGSP